MNIIYGYDFYPKNTNVLKIKKSGLAYYNNILVYGLMERGFKPKFIRSYYGSKQNIHKKIIDNIEIFNMPVKFPELFEPNGTYEPKIASEYYKSITLDNPVYSTLSANLYKIIRKHNGKIININTHNLIPGITACITKKRHHLSNLNLFATIHDVDYPMLEYLVANQSYVNKFISISNANTKILKEQGALPSKIVKIDNGLDIDKLNYDLEMSRADETWSKLAERNKINCRSRIITLPARRVPHKGHKIAIKAIDHINRNYPYICTLLITGSKMGTESYMKELTEFVACNGQSDEIVFMDELSSVELAALYDNSNVVITPSTEKEGFCYANVECMLVGKAPVVTANHGGVLDYVKHLETGYLANVNDYIDLANGILTFLRNNKLKNSVVNKANNVAKAYCKKRMIDAYANIMEGN